MWNPPRLCNLAPGTNGVKYSFFYKFLVITDTTEVYFSFHNPSAKWPTKGFWDFKFNLFGRLFLDQCIPLDYCILATYFLCVCHPSLIALRSILCFFLSEPRSHGAYLDIILWCWRRKPLNPKSYKPSSVCKPEQPSVAIWPKSCISLRSLSRALLWRWAEMCCIW